MEVGTHIKGHRGRLGLSQDDLAERVYVSRQTISSWENGKTYPDVQSLLILSGLFGTTVDELIKGDVEAMTKTIDTDIRTMNRLSCVMLVFLVLTVASGVWFSIQITSWGWEFAQALPTLLLTVVLWGIAMAAAVVVERIKKNHDLITYQEICAYMNGEEVDRETPKGRRVRDAAGWGKVLRAVCYALAGAAAGCGLMIVFMQLGRVLVG